MKSIITILVLILIAGGAYLLLTGDQTGDSVNYTSDMFTFIASDGSQLSIQYDDSADFAELRIDGEQYALERSRAASGAKYTSADGSVVFWEHQGEAMVEINGETVVENAVLENANVAAGTTQLNFTVAPEKQACEGAGAQDCLVVNGELFYDSIEGFTFEPGYEYELLVARSERENVPADASTYAYSLVRMLSRAPVANTHELASTTWQWDETRYDTAAAVTPDEPDAFELTFGSDGRFSATTDCNTVFGNYTFEDDDVLWFGKIASTKMACPGGSQEQVFAEALDATEGYEINDGNELVLILESDGGRMVFSPVAR